MAVHVAPLCSLAGDKPEVSRADLVLPPDAEGRQRHIRTLDEKLVHRSEVALGPRPGKVMQIVGGRHMGLACRVVELLPQKEHRSSELGNNRLCALHLCVCVCSCARVT
eukprot:1154872-Pelagomonas_calceolata.AAC.1